MLAIRLASATSLVAMLIAPAAAQSPTQQIIHLSSYGFAPSPIRLAAGAPVTLTFVNDSGKGHDFSAKEFFAASRITAGNALNGKVDLNARESKSITLVPAPGTFHVHCSHFMHDALGMHTEIIVS
jgi:plastocyanin